MDYQRLLTELLKQSGRERELLKESKSLADANFVSILREEAALVENSDLARWAKIQYLLGLVYYYHLEDIEENYQQVIAFFHQALSVFSESDFPVEWATVQNYLGNVCRNLDKGKSETKIEKAIAHYQNALKVHQQNTYPQLWCSTQYNLGVTYGMLAEVVEEPDRANYLEEARVSFENFLGFTEPHTEPKWAETKIAVGALVQESVLGERVENLRYAINCYQSALKIGEAKRNKKVVASALDYLGHGYRALSQHEDRKGNLGRAYHAYQNALSLYDRATQLYNRAATQNDLGTIYIEAGKIKRAIACFKAALSVFTPNTFPLECTRIGRNLGNLAFENQFWTEAIEGYDRAIEGVEVSRDRTNSDEQRQAIIQEALDVYSRMVEACIKSGTEQHLAKALETVERSRSRYLVDLIASHELDRADMYQDEKKYLAKYEHIQQQIDGLRSKYEQKIPPGKNSVRNPFKSIVDIKNNRIEISPEDIQQLDSWETEKKQIWRQLRKSDHVLAGQVRVEPQEFVKLQQLIDSPTTAIVSFYSAFNHTYIFILRQSGITYHLCPDLSLEELNEWLQAHWFKPYQNANESDKQSWIANMEFTLQQLATKLGLEKLVSDRLEDLTDLIIVPHQLLHLIPFAALPLANGDYLGDRFALRVVPSCQVLAFCQEREQTLPPFTYGTIVYSRSGLAFSAIEEKLIAQMYDVPAHLRLKEEQASKNNYHHLLHTEKVQAVLSSHHAKFDLANPLESELTLANSKLTLLELLTLKWRMKELNEVCLSCCETGLGNPAATDDLLTLAAGFLCSGARSVISSLWVVDDGSTALLSFYYHQARLEGLSRPKALQQAQFRLRHLSDRDL